MPRKAKQIHPSVKAGLFVSIFPYKSFQFTLSFQQKNVLQRQPLIKNLSLTRHKFDTDHGYDIDIEGNERRKK